MKAIKLTPEEKNLANERFTNSMFTGENTENNEPFDIKKAVEQDPDLEIDDDGNVRVKQP